MSGAHGRHARTAPAPEPDDEPVPPSRAAVVAWWSVAAVVAALLVLGVGWTATGGRSFVVSTPSMSPTIPVGSLVLTRPTDANDLHVGEVIAFHPPTEPHTTYTHRIVAVLPGPAYSTKGDLDSSADAWVVVPKDVVGVEVHHFRHVGWLVRCLPWLAAGTLVLMGLAAYGRRSQRRATWLVGAAVVAAVPILALRPLVRGVFVGSGVVGDRVHAMVVNTGLLPLRFTIPGGASAHTSPGYAATLSTQVPSTGGLVIRGSLDLSPGGWVVVAAVCAIPLVVAMLVALRRTPTEAVA